jgi:hypothetical protein
MRGPLGVHRANNHRHWFYDGGSDITSQLDYLKTGPDIYANRNQPLSDWL